jgi:hypothetical protein
MKNGWVLLESAPASSPPTNETVRQMADEDLDEEMRRAFPPRR